MLDIAHLRARALEAGFDMAGAVSLDPRRILPGAASILLVGLSSYEAVGPALSRANIRPSRTEKPPSPRKIIYCR